MIKDLIKPGEENLDEFFGITPARGDYLYHKGHDIMNAAIDAENDDCINKQQIIQDIMNLAENENEEAFALYFAGHFIGELKQRIKNPLIGIMEAIESATNKTNQ